MKTPLRVMPSKSVIVNGVKQPIPRSPHRLLFRNGAFRHSQTGFSLLEISIAMFLAAMLWLWQVAETQPLKLTKLEIMEKLASYLPRLAWVHKML